MSFARLVEQDEVHFFRLLDGIAALLPGFVFVNDVIHMTNVYCSEKALAFAGYDQEYVEEAGNPFFLKMILPEDTPRLLKSWRDLGNSSTGRQIGVFRLKGQAETYCWVNMINQAIRFHTDGRIRWVLSIAFEGAEAKEALGFSDQLPEVAANQQDHANRFSLLTRREREVVQYILAGKGNTALAEDLHISIHTVKTHRKRIYKKLNISDRLELAKFEHYLKA